MPGLLPTILLYLSTLSLMGSVAPHPSSCQNHFDPRFHHSINFAAALSALESSPENIDPYLQVIHTALDRNEPVPSQELRKAMLYLQAKDKYTHEMRIRILSTAHRLYEKVNNEEDREAIDRFIKFGWLSRADREAWSPEAIVVAWNIITQHPRSLHPDTLVRWKAQLKNSHHLFNIENLLHVLSGYLRLGRQPPKDLAGALIDQIISKLNHEPGLSRSVLIANLEILSRLGIAGLRNFIDIWEQRFRKEADSFTTSELISVLYSFALADARPDETWIKEIVQRIDQLAETSGPEDIDRFFIVAKTFDLDQHPNFAKYPLADYLQMKARDTQPEPLSGLALALQTRLQGLSGQTLNNHVFNPSVAAYVGLSNDKLILEVAGPEHHLWGDGNTSQLKPELSLRSRILRKHGYNHRIVNWRKWGKDRDYQRSTLTLLLRILGTIRARNTEIEIDQPETDGNGIER